uniref:Uncharacterized protein n=1 Tax=Rhizophora mucronata TaxID=61149 RepID=A0A2P2NS71_RHIMU
MSERERILNLCE